MDGRGRAFWPLLLIVSACTINLQASAAQPEATAAVTAAMTPLQIETEFANAPDLGEERDPCDPALEAVYQHTQAMLDAVQALAVTFTVRPADLYNRLALIRDKQSDCESRDDSADLWMQAVADYRQAVDLETFDPMREVSYAVFRYNLALAEAANGNLPDAMAGLREAMQLDVDLGWADDFENDRDLIAQWLERLPQDDPERAVPLPVFPAQQDKITLTLKAPRQASGSARTDFDSALLQSGSPAPVRATSAVDMKFVEYRENGEWLTRITDFKVAPDDGGQSVSAQVQNLLQDLLTTVPVQVRSLDGQLLRLDGLDQVAERARQQIDARLKSGQMAQPDADAARAGLAKLTQQYFDPKAIFERVSIDAAYAGPFWDKAELDHGDWYEATVTGKAPVLSGVEIKYLHRFKFNRRVACESGSSSQDCVELLLEIEPDQDDLKRAVGEMLDKLTPEMAQRISNTLIRRRRTMVLRVDPATMAVMDLVDHEALLVVSDDARGPQWQLRSTRNHEHVLYDKRVY